MAISFDLTPAQEKLRTQTQEFAKREIAPLAREIDEKDDSRMLLPIWKKMAQPPYRYPGMLIPRAYGGHPRSILDICIVCEELAAISQSGISVLLIEGGALGTTTLISGGNEEQKKKYLPPVAKGRKAACFALTEPGTGSDAAALRTRAELKGDKYVLNGRKRYASLAHIASYTVVFAKTNPDAGAKGISAFIVPQGTPGFTVVEKIPCIGMRGHQDEEVTLENCVIPRENLIGEEGKGLKYALGTLDRTRTTLVAGYIGLARAALEESVKFANARTTFGKPIAENQAISFPLTDVAIDIEAARLLTYKAASLADKGVRHTVETAAAKAFASQTLLKATNLALEVHGGFGGTKRFAVERMLRDASIWVFAQGAINIQKIIVMRDLFKRLEPSPEMIKDIVEQG